MTTQKCAYCGWEIVPVDREGYLTRHFKGEEVCMGSGFVKSQMGRLIGDIARAKLEALEPTVVCKFCRILVPRATAHRHQGKWVGDKCCWDERLRISE